MLFFWHCGWRAHLNENFIPSVGLGILTEPFEIVRIKSQRLTVDSSPYPTLVSRSSFRYARLPWRRANLAFLGG
jgi:hypothetical protein